MPKKVNRMDRVNELIKRELAEVIEREWTESSLVTVTKVSVAPDLHNAKVFVSVFGGGETAEADAIRFLYKQRGEIQNRLASAVILKFTPILTFTLDHTIAKGSDVLAIMENLDIPEA